MKNNLLIAHIVVNGDSPQLLADELGISRQALMRKLKGLNDFKQSEMFLIKERYKMSDEEFVICFKEVRNVEN